MPDWTAWTPATCLPLDCFCEGDAGGLVRQPINALSNLAFLIAGAWIAARAKDGLGRLFAAIVIFIGLSSGFYHMSLTFIGQTFDVFAILLLPSLLILDNAAFEKNRPVLSLAWAYALGAAAFLALIIIFPTARRPLVAVLALALVLSERRVKRPRDARLLAAALGGFALAFLFWVPDRLQWICADALPPLGHAIWHCLCALAAAVLYLYLESETKPRPAPR